jgi:superfamily I DNA/RNA helicase
MPHLLVEAGPGSGKTTTLTKTHNYLLTGEITGKAPTQEQYIIMETARQMFPKITPNDAVFACMTNSGKEDLINKVPSATRVFTYNGLGASLLIRKHRFQKLDNKRGERLIEAVIGKRLQDLEWPQRRKYYTCLRYIKCLKEELQQPTEDSLYYIQQKYGIEAPPPENVGEMVSVMERMMRIDGTVEWIDQVWLAAQAFKEPPYELAYVDECQDLSLLKLLFVLRTAKNLFWCGDPYQAINGFAGADYNVFKRLIDLAQTHLPLKTCFRCPPNRIDKANRIRPARIVAWKTEKVPDISLSIEELPEYIKNNLQNPKEHLLIARLNNILLRVGIKLLKSGVSCYLMGRTGENGIDQVIKDYITQTRARSLKQLLECVNQDKINAESLGFQAGTFICERADCVIELAQGSTTIPQLLQKLHALTQSSSSAVPLATIHKAKGLEAKFVYILYPPIPLETNDPNQREQEINLEFVAETRSSHQTIYVQQ